MNAALEGEESDYDQNEHDDEHHALFAPRELENPEQALHRSVAQLSLLSSGNTAFFIRLPAGCHSERREESRIIVSKRPAALLARDV
jgi:hypothetical protein